MSKHEDKYCPRCNRLFECKAGNISLCQCNEIQLSRSLRSVIEEQYHDCLCIMCLQELAQLASNKENN